MMAAIAEFEPNTIYENVKMGMLARAREGKWNGGQVLGYDLEDISNQGDKRKHTRLVINEKEARTVKRIFELYIAGNGYKAIVNRVNKEGHLGKRGKPRIENFGIYCSLSKISMKGGASMTKDIRMKIVDLLNSHPDVSSNDYKEIKSYLFSLPNPMEGGFDLKEIFTIYINSEIVVDDKALEYMNLAKENTLKSFEAKNAVKDIELDDLISIIAYHTIVPSEVIYEILEDSNFSHLLSNFNDYECQLYIKTLKNNLEMELDFNPSELGIEVLIQLALLTVYGYIENCETLYSSMKMSRMYRILGEVKIKEVFSSMLWKTTSIIDSTSNTRYEPYFINDYKLTRNDSESVKLQKTAFFVLADGKYSFDLLKSNSYDLNNSYSEEYAGIFSGGTFGNLPYSGGEHFIAALELGIEKEILWLK